MTRPVLGGMVTFAGRDAPAGGACTLALSTLPVLPTNLGIAGCNAWFDVSNWVILAQPTQTPSWSISLPLPNARQLIGYEVALQAFYVGTSTPLGYDLTNGLWARLGY
jgi:hypothetical protein